VSDDVRLGLIVAGVAAVLLAVVWRFVVVSGRRRRIQKGLRASDPQDRARAGIVLVDQGLHRSARVLLAHVATEQDVRVNHAIALAVARRQWEPVDTLPVRQLREWASRELEQRGESISAFGPAVTRLSDMGGPRPPDDQPAAGTTEPATSGPVAAEPVASDPLADESPDAAPADPTPGVRWRADHPGSG
jgi:hypothetical protein